MTATARAPGRASEDRRRDILAAALGRFLRFGFRKTSMDDVARAAQLSRQGLYLHFPAKEALFEATVQFAFEEAQGAVERSLRAQGQPLAQRLLGAFDAWCGGYVGTQETEAADVVEMAKRLAGPVLETHEARFERAIARAISAAGISRERLSARELAETLHAAARGLKLTAPDRATFRKRMAVALRACGLHEDSR